MEKREYVMNYRQIGNHIVKLVKISIRNPLTGLFNKYQYKLIIDDTPMSFIDTYRNLDKTYFNKMFLNINEANIDLLVGKFKL